MKGKLRILSAVESLRIILTMGLSMLGCDFPVQAHLESAVALFLSESDHDTYLSPTFCDRVIGWLIVEKLVDTSAEAVDRSGWYKANEGIAQKKKSGGSPPMK